MSSLALSNLAAQTQRAAHAQTRGVNRFRRRWMHHALRRQGIMMPALSPFMTEGTVTRWKKREGESFQAGEVLLQIENEVGMVDVEASAPGILGKILTPDGTSHVPVESMIAIVARDATELATIQSQSLAPTPPPFSPTPIPPSSPRYPDAHYKIPMMSPRTPIMSPRTPSLFEMHTMGMGHRSAHVGGPRGARPAGLNLNLEEAPRSPRTPIHSSQEGDVNGDIDTPVTPAAATPFTAADICYTKTANANGVPQESHLDGAAIRRMIVANLSASRAMEVEEFV